MPSATNSEAVLGHIAELVARAAAQPDVPASLKPILDEIADLAGRRTGDTPEQSDVPQTENQSL